MEERNEVMENEVLTGEVVPATEESSDSRTLIGVAVGAVGTLAVLGSVKLFGKIKAKFAKDEDDEEEKKEKKSKKSKKAKKQVKADVNEDDSDEDEEESEE